MLPQRHAALFQLAAAALGPHPGGGVRVVDEVGRQVDGVGVLCALSQIRLDVHVLAHQQPIAAAELHIERVFAGVTGVAAAAVVIVAAALGGVVPVDAGDGALPRLVADTGADDDADALAEYRCVVLIDVALHAVAAGLHDGDQGQGIAVAVGAAVGVDALDLAGHLRLHGAVLYVLLQLLDVAVLFGDAAIDGLDVNVVLPDIQQQLAAGGIVHGLIQRILRLFLLVLLISQLGLQGFQIQLCRFQVELKLAHIIGEQHVAHVDGIACLDLDLADGHGVVLFDVGLAQRADHAGKTVRHTGGAQPADHGDGLHGCFAGALTAAGGHAQQHGQRQNESSFLHGVISFAFPLRCAAVFHIHV